MNCKKISKNYTYFEDFLFVYRLYKCKISLFTKYGEGVTYIKDNDFNNLVSEYSNYVFKICYSVTKDYFESEDLMQETFLSVYRNKDNIKEGSEKAYLAQAALNKSRDYLRKKSKFRKIIPLEEAEDIQSNESVLGNLLSEEIMANISKAINSLPTDYKDIAYSYYILGRSVSSYAAENKIKLKTAQSRLRRAREKIKIIYEREYGDG